MSSKFIFRKIQLLFHTPFVTHDPYEVAILHQMIREKHPMVADLVISEAIQRTLETMKPPRPLLRFLKKVEEHLHLVPETGMNV